MRCRHRALLLALMASQLGAISVVFFRWAGREGSDGVRGEPRAGPTPSATPASGGFT